MLLLKSSFRISIRSELFSVLFFYVCRYHRFQCAELLLLTESVVHDATPAPWRRCRKPQAAELPLWAISLGSLVP